MPSEARSFSTLADVPHITTLRDRAAETNSASAVAEGKEFDADKAAAYAKSFAISKAA